MTRKRGTASAIVCPQCGARYIHEQKTKTRRQPRRARKAQLFESTAPAPFQHSTARVAPQPWQREPEPVAEPRTPLQPGEKRRIEQKRPETLADVLTYVGKGAAIGLAGMCVSVPFTLIESVPWWSPFAVFPPAFGAGILLSVFNPQDWLIGLVEDVLQRDVDGDGQVGAQEPQRVLGTVRVEEPARGQTRYLNDVPLSCEMGEYITALLDDVHDVTFSERSAAQYGVEGADFVKLRDELIAREIVSWKNPRNPRSGYNEFNLAANRALAQVRDMCACVRA